MRITAFLDAIADTLRKAGLFEDVRVQLDPYDLDDVLKESFKPPAARVLFSLVKPVAKACGAIDLECTVTIAIVTVRQGRANPGFASADAAALELAIATSQLINDNPYFGLGKLTAARQDGFKVAVSEKSNAKGLAITLVMFKSTLLDVVTERAEIGETIGIRLPGPAVELPDDLQEIAEFEDDGL